MFARLQFSLRREETIDTERTPVNVYIALFIQQFIASSTHLIGKSVTTDIDPRLVVFLRACFTITAFGLWVYINRHRLPRFDTKDIPRLLLLGVLNIPINQLAFLSGLEYTTAPNAALLYALTPAFVFIIAIFFYGEQSSYRKLLGILLAFAGTVVVLFERGLDFNSTFFLGNIIVLGASISWAWYTVLGKSFILKYGPFYATALTMFSGFVLYIPVFMLFPLHSTLADVTPTNWLQLFYIGVITSGLGYGLWYYALAKIEASKVAVFNNCQPILTTILAILFLQQTPSPLFILGGVIAITGVILTQRG